MNVDECGCGVERCNNLVWFYGDEEVLDLYVSFILEFVVVYEFVGDNWWWK